MKKAFLVILWVVTAVFGFAACSAPAGTQGGDAPAVPTESPKTAGQGDVPADVEGKKIGVIFYGKDDALGQAVYATLNYAAEALDIEILWKVGDVDPTAQITSAENLVAAGCDGILCIPNADVVVQKVAKLCKENGVYFGICFRTIEDASIKADVEENEYFVGGCYEDELAAAEKMVQLMVDDGRKNFGVGYMYPSNALARRNLGFDQGIESTGSKMLAEYTMKETENLDETKATIQNYINSFPEMDGIIWCSGAQGRGEVITNTLRASAPDGKISLATFDVFDGMKDAFADGTLSVAVGGMSPDALMSFMMVYNAMIGMPLSDTVNYLPQNYIFITNEEECEGYEKYIDNPDYMIYKTEDIQAMSRAYNPDFDLEALKQIMSDYTMENVLANVEE